MHPQRSMTQRPYRLGQARSLERVLHKIASVFNGRAQCETFSQTRCDRRSQGTTRTPRARWDEPRTSKPILLPVQGAQDIDHFIAGRIAFQKVSPFDQHGLDPQSQKVVSQQTHAVFVVSDWH